MQKQKRTHWRLLPAMAAALLSGCAMPQPQPPLPLTKMGPAMVPAREASHSSLLPTAEITTADEGASAPPETFGMGPADPIGELIRPEAEVTFDPRVRALEVARQLLGTPYSHGGTSPAGFDCSGLVLYAFRQAGVELPRTSREQYRRSRLIDVARLEPGDLLFFRISRQGVAHVGIFVEADRFIHAPSTGKEVSYARLSDPYWRQRLIGAGRIVEP